MSALFKRTFKIENKEADCLWRELYDSEVRNAKNVRYFKCRFIFIDPSRLAITVNSYLIKAIDQILKVERNMFSYLYELKNHLSAKQNKLIKSKRKKNMSTSKVTGGDVAIWSCEIFEKWASFVDHTHSQLSNLRFFLKHMTRELDSVCVDLIAVLDAQKESSLKTSGK
ncbi:uncharacterized protein LOC142345428 [Convolutriloba macropyga]|uniref:uncharacterized protein LOC142345428 n=1 Tax=Convolutriloba macropyga TaxID=536237 RepID=UPI003F51DE67